MATRATLVITGKTSQTLETALFIAVAVDAEASVTHHVC